MPDTRELSGARRNPWITVALAMSLVGLLLGGAANALAAPNTVAAGSAAPLVAGYCPTRLDVGAGAIIARASCLAASDAAGTDRRARIAATPTEFTTTSAIELNGMMLDPSVVSGGQLTINTVTRTISDPDNVLVSASNIALSDQPINWELPPSSGAALQGLAAGQIADLRQPSAMPVQFVPSALPASALPSGMVNNLKDFVISGPVTPVLDPGGASQEAQLPTNVVLPSPIGGFLPGAQPTSEIELLAGNTIPGGLDLGTNSIDINLSDISLGITTIKKLDIDYDGDNPTKFYGALDVELPLAGEIDGHIEFENGEFFEGDLEVTGLPIPLGPDDVFLSEVDVTVYKRNGACTANFNPPPPGQPPDMSGNNPTYIAGGFTVALAPLELPPFSLHAEASFTLPESSCNPPEPGKFSLTGEAAIFKIPVASAFVTYQTATADASAVFSFGGSVGLSALGFGIDGGVSGAVGGSGFYISGYVSAKAFYQTIGSVDVLVSTKGIGGCLGSAEIEYNFDAPHWAGTSLTSCNLTNLVPQGLPAPARDATAAAVPVSVRVPRHVGLEAIVLDSPAGAPVVSVTGPGGVSLTTPTPPAGGGAVISSPPGAHIVVTPPDASIGITDGETVVELSHPKGGTYTVTPQPGSPAITALSTAHGLPPISVHAHVVSASGRAHYLVYKSTPAPGRSVTFLEQDVDGAKSVIGTTSRAHGRIRFLPGGGPAGRRAILAQVTERGTGDGLSKVASYLAPGPPRLARPSPVVVKRHGSSITISWGRVQGAAQYVVRPTLKDGRALVFLVSATRHSVTVPAVQGFDAGNVMVAALNASNIPGAIGSTKLMAMKPTCLSPRAVKGKLVCRVNKHKHGKHRKGTRTAVT